MKIAPKKLNPEGKAWLPIMNADREGWHFTILLSNTQRAHDLGKTNDWVVVYCNDGNANRNVRYQGPLTGKRVIRGREHECKEFTQHEA